MTVQEGTPVRQRIRSARVRAGLSQKALAKAIGTSRRHVIRWENGTHKPKPAYAIRIAEATGTTPELFIDEDEEEPSLEEFFRFAVAEFMRKRSTGNTEAAAPIGIESAAASE